MSASAISSRAPTSERRRLAEDHSRAGDHQDERQDWLRLDPEESKHPRFRLARKRATQMLFVDDRPLSPKFMVSPGRSRQGELKYGAARFIHICP